MKIKELKEFGIINPNTTVLVKELGSVGGERVDSFYNISKIFVNRTIAEICPKDKETLEIWLK